MLSENHHAAYWLFAIAARILYEVLSACGWRHTVVGSLLLLGAIERLMFHWSPPIPTRHKILLLREWGDLPYYEIMGCCLVGLGVLVDLTANHEDGVSSAAMLGQSRAIHILVAFSVLGIVEPIRQNVRKCHFPLHFPLPLIAPPSRHTFLLTATHICRGPMLNLASYCRHASYLLTPIPHVYAPTATCSAWSVSRWHLCYSTSSCICPSSEDSP